MSCLENIIGIKAPCSPDTAPLSGQYINDYPGITLRSAANNADSEVLTGYNYLVDLRRRAMNKLNNDLLSIINQDYDVSSFATMPIEAAKFRDPKTVISAGSAELRRGLVGSKRTTKCRFHKMVIHKVHIYSNYTGATNLKISDPLAGQTTSATIELAAGEVREFIINQTITGPEFQITLPANIPVYSTKPECGCDGKPKNEYIEFNGINNTDAVSTESYGIKAFVIMKCDISSLVCEMAVDGIIGQSAFELMGAMFYDDMLKSERLNYLTIYKEAEIKEQSVAGFAMYKQYMENAIRGLDKYINRVDGNCGCVQCDKVKLQTNV